MNNLNSFIMDGHLASDPEFITTERKNSLCKFSVGVNRSYKDVQKKVIEEVVFIPVEVWGVMSENCAKYLHKGDAVRVMGRLKEDKWESENGQKHSRLSVYADRVDFLSKKKRDEVVSIDVENGSTSVSSTEL